MSEGWNAALVVSIISLAFAVWREFTPRVRLRTDIELVLRAKELGLVDAATLESVKDRLASELDALGLGKVQASGSEGDGVSTWLRGMATALALAIFFNAVLVAHRFTVATSWRDDLGAEVVIEALCAFILFASARDILRLRRLERSRAELAQKYAERVAVDPEVSG